MLHNDAARGSSHLGPQRILYYIQALFFLGKTYMHKNWTMYTWSPKIIFHLKFSGVYSLKPHFLKERWFHNVPFSTFQIGGYHGQWPGISSAQLCWAPGTSSCHCQPAVEHARESVREFTECGRRKGVSIQIGHFRSEDRLVARGWPSEYWHSIRDFGGNVTHITKRLLKRNEGNGIYIESSFRCYVSSFRRFSQIPSTCRSSFLWFCHT